MDWMHKYRAKVSDDFRFPLSATRMRRGVHATNTNDDDAELASISGVSLAKL
jgi:hypothetical protein